MSKNLVQTRRQGALGAIYLNRPKALNALNQQMIDDISAALNKWRDDSNIKTILIHSTGEKGLCAGGDVREIRKFVLDGKLAQADYFFQSEYRMNELIATYPKPIVALMDGITMGGGVGISSHASHRIVTERTRLAMPECAIGFFCDVGSTHLLARAPAGVGNYIGLAGSAISGDDAIFANLADAKINSADIDLLIADLEKAGFSGESMEVTVEKFAQPRTPGDLETLSADLASLFEAGSLKQIMQNLLAENSDWASSISTLLKSRCPLSLAVVFQAIKHATNSPSLRETLETEFVLARNMVRTPNFVEGVRAVLVDKDHSPRWAPATLDELDPAFIAAQFDASTLDDLLF